AFVVYADLLLRANLGDQITEVDRVHKDRLDRNRKLLAGSERLDQRLLDRLRRAQVPETRQAVRMLRAIDSEKAISRSRAGPRQPAGQTRDRVAVVARNQHVVASGRTADRVDGCGQHQCSGCRIDPGDLQLGAVVEQTRGTHPGAVVRGELDIPAHL